MLKIKLAYNYLSEINLLKIKSDFERLNNLNKFSKNAEAFQKYEERDIMSDYDDEGKYAEKNIYENFSLIDTSKIGGESDSEYSPPNKSFLDSFAE